MTQGSSHYPISKLIARIIDESELSRSEFIQRLGYRNSVKGLRRLDVWLADGDGNADCLQKIVDAFHPDPAELKNALEETEAVRQRERRGAVAEIEERERRRFKPFIWVHTEDGAHSLFTAMAERQEKVLWMKEGFELLSAPEQLRAVQQKIRSHFRVMGGRYPGFGKILQYRWAVTFDTSAVLDTNGTVIDDKGERFLLPEVWLELH
jgi:hypothetical protein